jgi:hypothetical protein
MFDITNLRIPESLNPVGIVLQKPMTSKHAQKERNVNVKALRNPTDRGIILVAHRSTMRKVGSPHFSFMQGYFTLLTPTKGM